ncbi:hypothetical protein EDD85DRAFT_343827 [Armillaria nabsnona]|nr:hypothetical protein EDD85DRAFT_343827 [Armillaria nabsnona]
MHPLTGASLTDTSHHVIGPVCHRAERSPGRALDGTFRSALLILLIHVFVLYTLQTYAAALLFPRRLSLPLLNLCLSFRLFYFVVNVALSPMGTVWHPRLGCCSNFIFCFGTTGFGSGRRQLVQFYLLHRQGHGIKGTSRGS